MADINKNAVNDAATSKKKSGLTKAFDKLSKREQSLLCIGLIAVLLMVIVFLLILPGLNKLEELGEEADDLYYELDMMQRATGNMVVYQQLYDDSREQYEAAIKKFFKPMKPETLDERVTGFLISAGYEPETLSLTPLGVEFVPEFTGTSEGLLNEVLGNEPGSDSTAVAGQDENNAEQGDGTDQGDGAAGDGTTGDGTDQGDGTTAGDGTDQGDGTTAGDGTADQDGEGTEGEAADQGGEEEMPAGPTGAASFVYTVNVSASGDWSNLYRLLDNLKDKNGVEVVSYEYNEATTEMGPAGAGPGTTSTIGSAMNSVAPEYDSISMVLKLYVYVEGMSAGQSYADAALIQE